MKRAQRLRPAGITTVFRNFCGALLVGAAVTTVLPLNAYSTERELVSTITRLYAYSYTQTGEGEGDVVVEVSTAPTQCAQGFWISADDRGSKSAYALLLSAYHTQTAVRIIAEDTQNWPPSSSAICRIIAVALE